MAIGITWILSSNQLRKEEFTSGWIVFGAEWLAPVKCR